ncbi:hypothetical protein [Brevundimonas sp. Marseille-Q4549]
MSITLRIIGSLWILSLPLLAGACGTAARPIPLTDLTPRPNRAIVLFSLQVLEDTAPVSTSPEQPAGRYEVALDRYDLTRQTIVGGCFSRRDIVQAKIAGKPGSPAYFAFDVPAGAYVISPFMSHRDHHDQAWMVPVGSITYVGAFTRTPSPSSVAGYDFTTEHTDHLAQAREDTGLDLSPAQTLNVTPPRIYICTP